MAVIFDEVTVSAPPPTAPGAAEASRAGEAASVPEPVPLADQLREIEVRCARLRAD